MGSYLARGDYIEERSLSRCLVSVSAMEDLCTLRSCWRWHTCNPTTAISAALEKKRLNGAVSELSDMYMRCTHPLNHRKKFVNKFGMRDYFEFKRR